MSASEVDRIAAAWAARLDAGHLDPDAEAELDAWRAADPRHEGALLRAQAAWTLLDRARALRLASMAPRRLGWGSRTVRWVAACLLAGLMLGVACACWQATSAETLRTPPNQILRARLEDGSVAVLNSGATIRVNMRGHERNVRVVQGEVWFKVAHDTSRPFLVRVGDARARAVGTAFLVRLAGRQAEILVTEGVVQAEVVNDNAPPTLLKAGWEATTDGRALKTREAGAEAKLSLPWREGQITLNGLTLQEAVAEFNAYNRIKIVVADPELAAQRMVGWFFIDDPELFASAAARSVNAILVHENDRLVIRRP